MVNIVYFKSKNIVSTTRPLKLLHVDLFSPPRTKNLGGNLYVLVIVDDYSRFTWTLFLAYKHDDFNSFKKNIKILQNKKSLNIASIWSDHGEEFQNASFEGFYYEYGIS